MSVNTSFQADWKPDPQAAVFKVGKYIQSCGTAIVNSAGLQTRPSVDFPWATVAKIRAPDECVNAFLGGTGML